MNPPVGPDRSASLAGTPATPAATLPPTPLFITGTDTGVGKTLLTALLLAHLRSSGTGAIAVKPFASGSQADARLLERLQADAGFAGPVNPFFFPEPLAPLVAARHHRTRVPLSRVLAWLGSLPTASRPVLIEGAGGLLTPLGPGYTLRDLITAVAGQVVVVARNRLGVLNQVLLVREALAATTPPVAVVLMGQRVPDPSVATNARVLAAWIAPVPVFELPFLGAGASRPGTVRELAARHRRVLQRIAATTARRRPAPFTQAPFSHDPIHPRAMARGGRPPVPDPPTGRRRSVS